MSADLPELGVGIIYSSAVDQLLRDEPGLVDVVEIEPQTLWTLGGSDSYRDRDAEVLLHLRSLPCRKLVHSVGTPAGGTVRPEVHELQRLNHWATELDTPWWSDHLSFNRTPEFSTGFFLPPQQSLASVDVLSAGIADLKKGLAKPLALETGVNYLKRQAGELPDGEFVARTVEAADCGILLDLHNIFTNALNGRQSVDEFLSQIPLERVWEVHLAGGMWQDGFWLDAHSGPMPDELLALAENIIPKLSQLRAIMFEIFPSFVPIVGFDAIRDDVSKLRKLWDLRQPKPVLVGLLYEKVRPSKSQAVSAQEWEAALGKAVVGQDSGGGVQDGLHADPAVALVRGLVHEFRASMISRVMPLTIRLIMLMMSPEVLRSLLRDFEAKCTPRMYASREALAFADYLDSLNLQVPRLARIVAFERAIVQTLEDDVTRVVGFDFEPLPFLRALADWRLPEDVPVQGNFEIEVTGADRRVSAAIT